MAAFDVSDIYREHCFLFRISVSKKEDVEVHEVYGGEPGPEDRVWQPETVLRISLERKKWNLISGRIAMEFNRRLKGMKKRVGRWVTGDNPVQRLLGKEALVLMWAIEEERIGEKDIEAAIRNWLGLRPEERWWLYTVTAATTGLPRHAGIGWRAALSHALCYEETEGPISLDIIAVHGWLPARENPNLRHPRPRDDGLADGGVA